MAAAAGLAAQVINFGYLGDGNLHYNELLPAGLAPDAVKANFRLLNRAVHCLVVAFNGSISAEHGIGQLRRDELRHYKSPLEMEMMMAIKRAFDPNLIMNPGKLLVATIVPRPIALVTTWSQASGDNAAPFSFFNVMGEDPPVLVLGIENRRDNGAPKHTTANIRDNGQFVVHMVDEVLAQAERLRDGLSTGGE